ncbi:MAG: LamG-like jellyroll fold domain-containing protein [Candidatus Krumholzibacteriota bacterium]
MRQVPFIFLAVVFLVLAGNPVCAQYSTSDTLKAVAPGLVYKEFSRIIPNSNNLWRVTDPDATYVGDPNNSPSTFLPNPVLSLSVSDLQGAIRAVAVIDVWGGHIGTIGKQFRLNGNNWIDIPEIANTPTSPECYNHQFSIEVEVPLADLVQGNNSLEGISDRQTCYSFGWGQWGWYGFLLRVFYDPGQKTAPTGNITSPAAGDTIGISPVFTADAASGAGISRVEFIGYYDDYDADGDGIFTDWQQSYHRLRSDTSVMIRNHIGTTISSPFSVSWDNSWIPDQPAGGMEVVARIRDANGLWFVTDRVSGLTLSRPGISVAMYRPTGVPEKYWVRAGRTRSSDFVIPAGHDLVNAESARLLVATWNGLNGEAEPGEVHWTRVNGWTTPVFGEDHSYSFDQIEIPTNILQNGTNTVTVYSASSHHGAEYLWPGPGVVVRYVDYSNVPASVVTQPSSTFALEGATATFGVVAVGADPLSFQWQVNGMDIPAAADSTYTTPPLAAVNDGDLYRCVVTNGLGGDVSDEAVLTVLVPGSRATAGQVVLYDFNEGGGNTVNDLSGVGTPADLVIDDPGAVGWLAGALSVNGSTVIGTAGASTKLIDAVTATNEITIEAWIKPANLTQNGPARIVTLSPDTGTRNFTLGQGVYGEASDVYEVRLRSTTTDLNGKPALATLVGTLTTELSHVVFTRNSAGLTRIFVDGVERVNGQTTGDFSNWDGSYRLGVANELTGDRPWLGELHLVALFDRSLPLEDILQNYAAGSEPEPAGEINVTVFPVQALGGPVSLFATPDGLGHPLTAALSWDGVSGAAPIEVDAAIGVQVVDGFGDPVVGFPAEKISVRSQYGGWTQCPGSPLTADGPTDATGATTISGVLFAGGHSGPGELLQVSVDDPLLNTTSYPGGLDGLEYFVNGADITGDLEVSLNDVADFAGIYFGEAYDYAADFVWDGMINLSDVAKLGPVMGVSCPVPAKTIVAGGGSAGTRLVGTMGVVFDAAGIWSSRMLDPGEQIDAYVVLHGSAAQTGIEAFDLRIRVSGNVVVHQQDLVGTGLDFTAGDGLVVGYPVTRRTLSDRPLQLVHMRVSVTDAEPAYFWVGSGSGSEGQPPSVVLEGEIHPTLPASGDVAMAVAGLNDGEFALDNGNTPRPQLSMRIAPNPFNPMTGIRFSLPSSGPVELRVFDARGQLVKTLLGEVMPAGEHEVVWNGTDGRGRAVASGVYFSKLETGAGDLLQKMMLVR